MIELYVFLAIIKLVLTVIYWERLVKFFTYDLPFHIGYIIGEIRWIAIKHPVDLPFMFIAVCIIVYFFLTVSC